MSDIALLIAIVVAQAIFGFIFLKLVPTAIMKFAEKEIERRSDIELEKVKGEIQGSYATLKSSVEMLTASNTGLHPHIIDTVSALWGLIVEMKHSFGGLVAFDSVFLASEAAEAFKDATKHKRRLEFVEKHRYEFENLAANGAVLAPNLDRHRLFCGDRLWLVFFITRAVYLRASLLIARSYQTKDFKDWREDDGIRQLLGAALTKEFIDEVRARAIGGLTAAIAQLEAEFLHEATRVMSGSKAMADSLTNMQSVMQLQNAQIAAKVEGNG